MESHRGPHRDWQGRLDNVSPSRSSLHCCRKRFVRTEGLLVSQRYEDETVMYQCRHSGDYGALLSTTEGAGGNEDTSILAPVAAGRPLLAGLVPEGLPLGWEVTVTGGNTEEDSVERLELGRVVEDGDVGRLGRSVHLGQDLISESLSNPRQRVRFGT